MKHLFHCRKRTNLTLGFSPYLQAGSAGKNNPLVLYEFLDRVLEEWKFCISNFNAFPSRKIFTE